MKIRLLSIGGAAAGGLVIGAYCLFPALGYIANEVFALVPRLGILFIDSLLLRLAVLALIAGCLGGPIFGLLSTVIKKEPVYLIAAAVGMLFTLALLYCWVRTVFFHGIALRALDEILALLGSPYFWLLTGIVACQATQTGLYAAAAMLAFKSRTIRAAAGKDVKSGVREDGRGVKKDGFGKNDCGKQDGRG